MSESPFIVLHISKTCRFQIYIIYPPALKAVNIPAFMTAELVQDMLKPFGVLDSFAGKEIINSACPGWGEGGGIYLCG